MPGKQLQFGMRGPKETLCRTCLFVFSKKYPQIWTAAYSSATTRRRAAPRTISRRPSSALRPRTERSRLEASNNDDAAVKNLTDSLQNAALSGGNFNAQANATVNFFEQDGQTRHRLADEGAFEHSMNSVDTFDLKGALDEMKTSIAGEDDKKAFGQVMGHLEQIFVRGQGAPDVDKVKQRLEEYTQSIDLRIQEALSDLPQDVRDKVNFDLPDLSTDLPLPIQGMKTPSPQVLEGPWTLNQRRRITRLNKALDRVYRAMQKPSGPTQKNYVDVYKTYHAARLTLAYSWSHVHIQVWDLLWKVFSVDEEINMHRIAHISLLSRDMNAAKVPFNPSQQLLAIEAMFVQGCEELAIENWKRCISTLGRETAKTCKGFWELGVLMHCRTGEVEQAQRASNKLISKGPDARILLRLIQPFLEKGTPESLQKAWDTYRHMRKLLGKSMTLDDYDIVVAYFLAAGHAERGLYAFVDMMSDGKIDMTTQKYMPAAVANKFFVGKWLKRLIGAGNLDGAATVVEYMRTKGVEAAPIQINGLIGAFQRSGGAADLERSEKIAWEMIQNRIEFVRRRRKEPLAESDEKRLEADSLMLALAPTPTPAPAPLPRATLETFCIMAENYRLRKLRNKVDELWKAFHEAEMSPNSFMMNQLLESHIQEGNYGKAVELHKALVDDGRGVAPDPYTFSALWKTLAVSRVHLVTPDMVMEAVAATRDMFAQTVACRALFVPAMDGQLARKILHSFRRVHDTAGSIVALMALRHLFAFFPTDLIVLELVLETTRLSWDTRPQRRKLLQMRRDIDRDLIDWTAGDDASKLEGEYRGLALYGFLLRRYLQQLGGFKAACKDIVAASKAMGVYEFEIPGDELKS